MPFCRCLLVSISEVKYSAQYKIWMPEHQKMALLSIEKCHCISRHDTNRSQRSEGRLWLWRRKCAHQTIEKEMRFGYAAVTVAVAVQNAIHPLYYINVNLNEMRNWNVKIISNVIYEFIIIHNKGQSIRGRHDCIHIIPMHIAQANTWCCTLRLYLSLCVCVSPYRSH